MEIPTDAPAPASYADTSTAVVSRGGVSWRTLMISTLFVLVGGGAVGGWLAWQYAGANAAGSLAPAAPRMAGPRPGSAGAVPVPPDRIAATGAVPAQSQPLTATQEATLATRLSLLEDRLARIGVAAEGASGNAAKAEAMLLALAARRAIDRGLPLGVLEGQLRLRFGESQPVAVDAIIAAGRAPVSEAELSEQLAAIRGRLDVAPGASILDRLRAGIDSLIVIRPNAAPSGASEDRYARAQRSLARDRIDLALAEVEAMRGARDADVAAWLRRARLRNDATRALDLIESAAILDPGSPAAAPTAN